MQNIVDVKIIDIKINQDKRGSYNEIFRANWKDSPKLVQWSVTISNKNAIRGMRVHLKHYDYTCLCHGKALYILKDLRKNSPTFGQNQYLELNGNKLQAIITPPGVAHGFYFHQYSIFTVGISQYYDPKDELGFYYQDPKAKLKWPKEKLIVSPRDNGLPPLEKLLPIVPAYKKHV